MTTISRRSFVLCAGFGFASLAAGPTLAMPPTRAGRFSEIQVDISVLQNDSYGKQADWVRRDLSRALAKLFPTRAGRGAPRLIVTPRSMSLGEYSDAHDPGTDYLYGDAMVVAPDKSVLQTYPIKLALPPQEAGRWDLPDIDRRRVKSLCDVFAGWVARYVSQDQ